MHYEDVQVSICNKNIKKVDWKFYSVIFKTNGVNYTEKYIKPKSCVAGNFNVPLSVSVGSKTNIIVEDLKTHLTYIEFCSQYESRHSFRIHVWFILFIDF